MIVSSAYICYNTITKFTEHCLKIIYFILNHLSNSLMLPFIILIKNYKDYSYSFLELTS